MENGKEIAVSKQTNLDETTEDLEVDFNVAPQDSGLETAEIWKAKYQALESQMKAFMAAAPFKVSTCNTEAPLLPEETSIPHARVNITSVSNSEIGEVALYPSPAVATGSTRRDCALDALSKPLFHKLIPKEFSGLGGSDPIAFVHALRRLLRLQPLSLREFLILVNTLVTGRAARWLMTIEPTIETIDNFFLLFDKEFVSRQYVKFLKSGLAREFHREGETVTDFVDRMCALFDGLPFDTDDIEIVETIVEKLDPEAAMHLIDKEFLNVGQLRATALKIDSVQERTASRNQFYSANSYPKLGLNESRRDVPSEQRAPDNRPWGAGVGARVRFPSPLPHKAEKPSSQAPRNFEEDPYSNTLAKGRGEHFGPPICFRCKLPGHIRRFCTARISEPGNGPPADQGVPTAESAEF